MYARIANSYFPDRKAYKEAKFDIKQAIMDGLERQRQIREFNEQRAELAGRPEGTRKQEVLLMDSNDQDVQKTQ